jgi:hypothetical protein
MRKRNGLPRSMKPSRILILFILSVLISPVWFCGTGLAQEDTGNIGGVIESAGLRAPYGINDQTVLKSQDYMTRQHRRGNESGIGGSFLQTTSPTNESSPAVRRNTISPSVQGESAFLPKLPKSMYGNIEKSPALIIDINQESPTIYSEKQKAFSSPALTRPIQQPSAMSQNEPPIKAPVMEPLQHLNKHRTGGDSISIP